MKMKRLFSILLIAALAAPIPVADAQDRGVGGSAAAVSTATAATASRGNVDYITEARMREYLSFIASDELEGRDTPSPGLDAAAKYIADHLKRWGVKPAGDDGTYFQRIALRRTKLDAAATRAEIGGQSFSFGEDFLAQPIPGTASAPLVFVGYGWTVKSKNLNPYQNFDVKDKIVVALGGFPKGLVPTDLVGKQGEDWANPIDNAQKLGAKGLIIIPSAQGLANWPQTRRVVTEFGALQVDKFIKPNAGQVPVISVNTKMAEALLQGEKQASVILNPETRHQAEPFELSRDKKVSLTVAVRAETLWTQNVIGVLEGRDPVLKNEYVAIGAHYDHVGKGLPSEDPSKFPPKDKNTADVIYNGADDDGSGTVAVLMMAEAFARSSGVRPKRSILFIWHCGEEKGLWGSQYFTEYPTVPLNQIITELNIDMIGRSRRPGDANPANDKLAKPNEVFLIGSKMMSTELGGLSEAVNKSYLNLSFNYKFDDPRDPEQYFYRSDHFNYARKGIPIIFYMDGDHEDYHRPSDSIEKIDFRQLEQVTRTIHATAWELANLPQRPRVDKPLSPGVAACQPPPPPAPAGDTDSPSLFSLDLLNFKAVSLMAATLDSTRRLLCAALCLLSVGAQSLSKAPPSAFRQKHLNFDELERVVLEELKATGTPGAAVAVVSGDRVIFARGFGVSSVETGAPVTTDMLFRIGSTTKMFTGAALVALAEKGRIELHQPVGNYVKGLSPRLAQVTAHQLLSHTAGMRDEGAGDGPLEDAALGLLARSWKDDFLFTEPGKIFSYSSPGYWLAGLLIEEAEGKPYADAMNELLFKPLGMNSTTFRPTVAMTYPLAQGHAISTDGKPAVVRPFVENAAVRPGGSMFSSVNDLARFTIALMNGGRIEGRQALQPATIMKTLAAPHAPQPDEPKASYGYGLLTYEDRGVRAAGHAGVRKGFGSIITLVPEHRFAVIVLANRSFSIMGKTAEKAMELVLPLRPKVEEQPKTPPLAMSAAEMEKYVGLYLNSPPSWEVFIRDDKLYLKLDGSESLLTRVGDHRFSIGAPGEGELVFVLDTKGKVEYLYTDLHAARREEPHAGDAKALRKD
jgi:CubicO group peptidase (beta-lactamase class C family)